MRTAEECLIKAAELTEMAEECPILEIREQLIDTANSWLHLAKFAAWQDGDSTTAH